MVVSMLPYVLHASPLRAGQGFDRLRAASFSPAAKRSSLSLRCCALAHISEAILAASGAALNADLSWGAPSWGRLAGAA